mmetsp:Transcript_16182/g.31451  ORF Transcript_16182/g.31451 Transcript_16182/m.31451 type:complete len:292 (+) Transcript_16182:1025-1900(+)
MGTGLRGEGRSPLKMSSEVSNEASNPSSLYALDLWHLDHVPATFPLNMKNAKQQRVAMKKRGIRNTQPHHCVTGPSASSSSSWFVSVVLLAEPAMTTTSVSLTPSVLVLLPASAWDFASAASTPTAANVGDGWTRPPVDCGEVAGNSPASRPRARAPVEAPTAPPMIPLSFSDSFGMLPSLPLKEEGCACGATGSLCPRKRILVGLFVVLPKLLSVPFPGLLLPWPPSALLPRSLSAPMVVLLVVPEVLVALAVLVVLVALVVQVVLLVVPVVLVLVVLVLVSVVALVVGL